MSGFLWFVRSLVTLLAVTSIHTAVGLTTGAVCGLAGDTIGKDWRVWFALGFFLPVAPLLIYTSSRKAIEKHLIHLDDWHKRGLITKGERDRLHRNVLNWYSRRQFGMTLSEDERTRNS